MKTNHVGIKIKIAIPRAVEKAPTANNNKLIIIGLSVKYTLTHYHLFYKL